MSSSSFLLSDYKAFFQILWQRGNLAFQNEVTRDLGLTRARRARRVRYLWARHRVLNCPWSSSDYRHSCTEKTKRKYTAKCIHLWRWKKINPCLSKGATRFSFTRLYKPGTHLWKTFVQASFFQRSSAPPSAATINIIVIFILQRRGLMNCLRPN